MHKRPGAILLSGWLIVLGVLPLFFLLHWQPRARALFQIKEPHIDFFFFHEAKAVYLNLALLCGALAIYFFTRPRTTESWAESGRERITQALPLLFFMAAIGLALPIYQNTALTLDEYAALFQARVFAAGEWAARLDPDLVPFLVPRFLQNYFFTVGPGGRVIETYLPGYALLLAPFAKLNLAWMLNPVLGTAILALIVRLAQKHFDGPTAFWAGLFALSSPILWVNSVSFYSLNCRLFFNLAFLYYLIPGRKPLSPRHAFFAGLCGGFAAFSHNPFPHAVFALPWLVYFAWRRDTRPYTGYVFLGYLPFVLLCAGWFYLVYHFQTVTPDSASTGFTYAWDVAAAAKGPKWQESTFAMWSISLCRLLLWCTPGIWFFFFSRRVRANAFLRVAGVSFLFTVLAYSLARNRVAQGFGWGHRYSYASLGGLFLVAAAYLAEKENSVALRRTALALVAAGAFLLTPLRLAQTQRFIATQRQKVPCLAETVTQVCFIDTWADYFMGDRVQNDPFLRTPRLILHSLGRAADGRLMRTKYPEYRLVKDDGKNSVWTPR